MSKETIMHLAFAWMSVGCNDIPDINSYDYHTVYICLSTVFGERKAAVSHLRLGNTFHLTVLLLQRRQVAGGDTHQRQRLYL